MTLDLAADLRTCTPPPGSVALWWLGQSGFVLKGAASGLIVIDPYLSDSIAAGDPQSIWQRRYAPPVAPDQLGGAEAVLCTHEHADHFDPASLLPILAAAPQALCIAPQWIAGDAAHAGIDPTRTRLLRGEGDRLELPGGARVTAYPAAHYQLEHDPQRGHRWQGFLIELEGVRIYHSGDTIIYPGLITQLRALDLDVLILPVNGRDYFRDQQEIVGNLWPGEAAGLSAAASARLTIPCHWDMFACNALPPGSIAAAYADHHPPQPFKLMAVGERLVYMP